MNFKEELAAKAENTAAAKKNDGIKLTTNMSIVDMIKTLEPEIRKVQREHSTFKYQLYLKYEWLQITLWEKIEEILRVYAEERQKRE